MFAFIQFKSSRRVARSVFPFGDLRRIAAAAALCVVATGAHANGALSFAEALSLAETRSSALTGADYAAQASREMAVAAAQLPDPVATMGINNLPVNGPDAWSLTRDFMTMASVGVMQEFTRKDKREARAERFRREADKAVAERAASVATLQRNAATAWLDRYYAEAMLAVVGEQSRQARVEIEAAEAAYRAGRGNLADVLAARSALVMLDDRASEFGRKVRAARIALARWVGDRADAPLAGRPDDRHTSAIDAEGTRRGTPAPPGTGHAQPSRRIWRPRKSGWRRPTASPTGASR